MPDYGPKSVYLGTDNSLTDTRYGDSNTERSGFTIKQTSDLDANANNSGDQAEAEVGAHSGSGSLTAWAYIGRSFEIKDSSGQQDATLTFEGSLDGALDLDSASNYVRAKMTVEDQDDNEKYDEKVYEKFDYIGGISESLQDSIVVPLEAGHIYGVKMEIMAEITVSDNGNYAVSNFHPDGTPGYNLTWYSVDIKF